MDPQHQQITLPEIDISETEFLSLENETLVPLAAEYNQWVLAVNTGTTPVGDAANSIYDLLLELHTHATTALETAHLAGQEDPSVAGWAYELNELLRAVQNASAALEHAKVLG